jgi:hypothetical protein
LIDNGDLSVLVTMFSAAFPLSDAKAPMMFCQYCYAFISAFEWHHGGVSI